MKTPLRTLPAVFFLAATAALACSPPPNQCIAPAPLPEPPALTYDTAEFIQSMPRCTGSVLEKFPCCARMVAADGRKFWIGSPGATNEVVRFVEALAECEDYVFPDAFLEWRKQERMRSVIMVVVCLVPPMGQWEVSGVFHSCAER
jgi:hypothetical protein